MRCDPPNARRASLLVVLAWPLVTACGSPERSFTEPPELETPGGPDVGAGGGGGGGGKAPDTRFDALIAAVQADLEASRGDASPTAVSVAVWLDGEVVWVCGLGTIDAQQSKGPPGEGTLFMIGSDTKKLTALSLLRKVDAGQVTLETTIADVLPALHMKLAPGFVTATIRELLSHQGGILDNTEVTTTTTDGALEGYTFGELAGTYYPLAPPGAIFNYSNPNFSLAGLLDQRLDGRMWPDIVEQDVFAPLGMSRTVARKTEVDADHADGVGLGGSLDDVTNGPVPLDELWDSGFARPSGLVWSTPSDQMRLAAFLVDGEPSLLAQDLLDELTSEQVSTDPDLTSGYGFGLFVDRGVYIADDWYDVPIWSHGGNTLSHSAWFYILPEQRFAISILTNGGVDDFTQSVATAMTTLTSLPAPSPAPEIPFEPAALDALTGTYVDGFNLGQVIVTRSGDLLEIELPALDEYQIAYDHEMTPLSTHDWLANLDGNTTDITFVEGLDGHTYFRNRGFVAIRASQLQSGPPPLDWTEPARGREGVQRALHAPRLEAMPASRKRSGR